VILWQCLCTYVLGVVPLMNVLLDDCTKQVWYADDTTTCELLRMCLGLNIEVILKHIELHLV